MRLRTLTAGRDSRECALLPGRAEVQPPASRQALLHCREHQRPHFARLPASGGYRGYYHRSHQTWICSQQQDSVRHSARGKNDVAAPMQRRLLHLLLLTSTVSTSSSVSPRDASSAPRALSAQCSSVPCRPSVRPSVVFGRSAAALLVGM